MQAECTLSEERLITTHGTIIPQAVRFANGNIFLSYHVGNDAHFSPVGAHFSRDDGRTWERCRHPLHRQAAAGAIDDGRAFLLDQYLFRTGNGQYVAFYSETCDSGESFSEPKPARFFLKGAIAEPYVPRPPDDPDAFFEPPIPEFYRPVTDKYGSIIGGHIFGTVLRLPDGALGLSAYTKMEGNMTRRPRRSTYVRQRTDDGTAPEAQERVLDSSLFFRSEDEGATWQHVSTIGKVRPDRPFDVGKVYSEGLNETGMACTSDGKIYALMRHGSLMLLWYAVSADGGRTWSDIQPFNYPGVAPSLTMLPCGILAAAWGRPGMTVGFSLDGTGRDWDLLVGVRGDDVKSQNYPWLVPVADDRVMLFYDKRKWDKEKRSFYDHGIYCREIRVRHR